MAHRAVPTIGTQQENGGHASLCPPYDSDLKETAMTPFENKARRRFGHN
jgi:hypothetical protein